MRDSAGWYSELGGSQYLDLSSRAKHCLCAASILVMMTLFLVLAAAAAAGVRDLFRRDGFGLMGNRGRSLRLCTLSMSDCS